MEKSSDLVSFFGTLKTARQKTTDGKSGLSQTKKSWQLLEIVFDTLYFWYLRLVPRNFCAIQYKRLPQLTFKLSILESNSLNLR